MLGAPYMERTTGFRRADCRLPAFRTELWNGSLYAHGRHRVRAMARELEVPRRERDGELPRVPRACAHARAWLATVYPAQVVAVFPTSVVWLAFQPRGVSEVQVRFGSAQLAELPAADSPAGVSLRDAICGGIERPIHEFERYLAARLARA